MLGCTGTGAAAPAITTTPTAIAAAGSSHLTPGFCPASTSVLTTTLQQPTPPEPPLQHSDRVLALIGRLASPGGASERVLAVIQQVVSGGPPGQALAACELLTEIASTVQASIQNAITPSDLEQVIEQGRWYSRMVDGVKQKMDSALGQAEKRMAEFQQSLDGASGDGRDERGGGGSGGDGRGGSGGNSGAGGSSRGDGFGQRGGNGGSDGAGKEEDTGMPETDLLNSFLEGRSSCGGMLLESIPLCYVEAGRMHHLVPAGLGACVGR